MKKLFSLLLILGISISIKAQTITSLSTVSNDKLTATGHVGFCCKEISSGRSIGSLNPQKTLTPASITKLITTSCALELLGSDYSFKTWIDCDTLPDSLGILNGNIYLHGEGDPTLASNYFKETLNFAQVWSKAIKEKGIKQINGHIIAEIGNFDTEYISPLWLVEDIGTYYGTGTYPLSCYDNTSNITLKSSENEIFITDIYPENSNPDLEINAKIVSSGKNNLYVRGNPATVNTRFIEGTILPNTESLLMKGDINNPPLLLTNILKKQLILDSVEVLGDTRVEFNIPKKRINLFTYQSPQLKEIIRNINVYSNNVSAEHLMKRIALQNDSIATTLGGVKTVFEYWKSVGINTEGQYQYDGSGLTPKNALSPEFMVDILCYMQNKSQYADDFYNSLPTVGKDGTVSTVLKNCSARSSFKMKSGSFRNVLCYAGYFTKNNKKYAFCIMMNNFNGTRWQALKYIETVLTEVYNKA